MLNSSVLSSLSTLVNLIRIHGMNFVNNLQCKCRYNSSRSRNQFLRVTCLSRVDSCTFLLWVHWLMTEKPVLAIICWILNSGTYHDKHCFLSNICRFPVQNFGL